MAIDYDKIMSMKTNDVEYSYTDNVQCFMLWVLVLEEIL